MNEKVRDAVLNLINVVIEQADGVRYRDQVQLSKRINNPSNPNEGAQLALCFGYGYFDGSKVFVYLDDQPQGHAEVEEAVAAYCESRMPKLITKG